LKPDMIVIIPTRDRPGAVAELCAAFTATCSAHTLLVFAVDADDSHLRDYVEAVTRQEDVARRKMWINEGAKTMVAALNGAVTYVLNAYPEVSAIAFMGDDHRPRTMGWDRHYLDALDELGTGIVYGNDLLQGERLPTQVAMTADVPRALGYMAPPTLTHLYVDNYWLSLGQAAGCLRYLPEVIVEHVHPAAGKALWDEGHLRVNAQSMYARDRFAYARYAGQAAVDLARVKALL
jgi:hypothetical protein